MSHLPRPEPRLRAAVVIATYNERENIEQLLPILLELPNLCIVVVDDASPDGTGTSVERIAAEHPGRITLVEREGKLGYGSACVAGFKVALELDVDAIVSMDADFSHDPTAVPDLLAALGRYDVVIGSRYLGGVRILNWSLTRLGLSVAANEYVRRILGFKIRDCTSGFRAYRRSVFEGLALRSIDSNGYSFLVEVLDRIVAAGHEVGEVPIVYEDREHGESKMDRRVVFESAWKPWAVLGRRLLDRVGTLADRVVNSGSTSGTRSLILALGGANALLLGALAFLSHGMALLLPAGQPQPNEAAFLESAGLLSILPVSPTVVAGLLSGSALDPAWVRVVVYTLPVLLVTLASWWVVARLARGGEELGEEHVRLALRFAWLYAALGLFAYPMLTQDMWAGIGWGRMVQAGANPFYEPLLRTLFTDLPLDSPEAKMTWGPLFGPLTYVLVLLGRGAPLLEFVAWKIAVAAAWLGCLHLLLRLLGGVGPGRRAIAVVLMGWLPISVHQTVFEAHNDALFVLPLLLWLVALREQRLVLGPMALAGSILLKYATAPLVLIELWWAHRQGWFRRREYRLGLGVATLFGLGVFGLYLRDLAFFDGIRAVQGWSFLSPGAALVDIGGLLGLRLPSQLATVTVLLVLTPMMAAVVGRARHMRAATDLSFLVFAVMGCFLAVGVGHLWPWYLLWLLPLALLVPRAGWATSFALSLATLAPLAMAWWIGAPSFGELHRPNLELYGAALLLTPVILGVLRTGRGPELGASSVAGLGRAPELQLEAE